MIELTFRNVIFNGGHLPNLRLPLDLWSQNEFGGGLGSQFRVQVSPHAKRCMIKLTFFIVFLEKREFLQMTQNIDILYTVENYFLPRLTVQDRYLKIRLCLARINCQSFADLYGKACQRSRHFRRQQRIPLQRKGLR